MQRRKTTPLTAEEVDRRERDRGLAPGAPERGPLMPGADVRPPFQPGVDSRGRNPLEGRDPHAVPAASWRTEILGSGVLNVLLGVWLIASPIVLGYHGGDPGWHDAIIGAAIAVVAVARLITRPWRAWMGWLNAGLGLWLLAGVFWRAESAAASWNDAIVGALVAALGAVAAAATDEARR
jgi:hypothetical protein